MLSSPALPGGILGQNVLAFLPAAIVCVLRVVNEDGGAS